MHRRSSPPHWLFIRPLRGAYESGCDAKRCEHEPPRLKQRLRTHPNQDVWFESFECLENGRKQRLKRLQAIAVGNEDHDGQRQRLQVLLELDVLVGSQHRVEQGCGLAKQRTVAQTGPTHLRDGANVVASQQVCQRPGQRFIEEESHERSAGPWPLPVPPRLVRVLRTENGRGIGRGYRRRPGNRAGS